MKSSQFTQGKFQKIVLLAIATLSGIILTGAAVRLTDSGLGCDDWPNCQENKIIPAYDFNSAIEFGNRILSAFVLISVIAVLVGAYKLKPKRKDLIELSWGLVIGVLTQIILGALTVILELHPIVVGLHFLISIFILWNVITLYERNTLKSDIKLPTSIRTNILVGLATLVLIGGVIVTGTGPNSGDTAAERLPLNIVDVTRVHSTLAWVLLIYVLIGLLNNRHTYIGKWLKLLTAAIIFQGALGYIQYVLGIPPLLVGIHIAGAVLIWIITLFTHYEFRKTKINK